ncbi:MULTISPECIES: RES domain-containing protein [unclassified Brenneria]|uniref:RES family NAD+ phosphorylase n=1 Tax=unclassified Brenneria TaxID=2634434 RepID=UPI0029C23237|nr:MULTISPECIES: RES domain-containing protein [unclassified Brenneria]MDX5628733.1 RES domain-containing protein [Brenneria sp. L3-3Z]MDX5695872.1 RES domain-containing protein [Brenneria sp. L4-2C]MEE3661160.1 RES domain-containing protein [Brenneria sp. g21c3]
MIFYRLIKTAYASEAWTGYGAKQYGGRWNHKGYPAIYVSTSISLAALEILVHVSKEAILEQYSLFSIDIPDDEVASLAPEFFPDNWRQDPAPVSTMDIGTGWLQSAEGVALIIPSSIIPAENNAILNPNHSGFTPCLNSTRELPFFFDRRLMK